jgi:hypothetical protein
MYAAQNTTVALQVEPLKFDIRRRGTTHCLARVQFDITVLVLKLRCVSCHVSSFYVLSISFYQYLTIV